MELTQAYLKEILHYNPETGIFIRLKRTGKSTHIGDIAGGINACRYITISIFNKRFFSHRIAWLYVYGEFPKYHIDHINGNRSDNRICNLRDVTVSGNQQNLKSAQKNNKSGFLGAHYNKRNKNWVARIYTNGKQIYIGTFNSPEKAHEAYLIKKRQFHNNCTI